MLRSPELKEVFDALPVEFRTPSTSYTGVVRPSDTQGAPACPRRYLYAQRLRWAIPFRSSPMAIGSLTHRFFAGLYSGSPLEAVTSALAGEVAKVIESCTDDKLRRSIQKDWSTTRVMVEAWVKAYGQPCDQLDAVKPLAIEQTIQKWLPEPKVTLVGTLDLAVDTPDGVFLVDHKTTSMLPDVFAAGLTFDVQSRLYRELWDSAHPDKRAVGMIHNILMRPGIIQKKNQTFEDYIAEVDNWYAVKMAEAPGSAPLMRSVVRFNEPSLDDNAELSALMADAAKWCNREPSLDTFYRNRKACVTFRSVCPYLDLCRSSCKAWPSILTTPGRFVRAEPPLDCALKGHGSVVDGVAEDLT